MLIRTGVREVPLVTGRPELDISVFLFLKNPNDFYSITSEISFAFHEWTFRSGVVHHSGTILPLYLYHFYELD